jgi:anaerobic ribonucleoside-triphosphate reductase activating protein
MLKYVDAKVVFQEIPDEITLAISISNCQIKCKGCHSAYLAKDKGTKLTFKELNRLLIENKGITCVCFMGEGKDRHSLLRLLMFVNMMFPSLKTAYYTGYKTCPTNILCFLDYVKVGPYIEEKGPITKETTNQRLYKVEKGEIVQDITKRFWKTNLKE